MEWWVHYGSCVFDCHHLWCYECSISIMTSRKGAQQAQFSSWRRLLQRIYGAYPSRSSCVRNYRIFYFRTSSWNISYDRNIFPKDPLGLASTRHHWCLVFSRIMRLCRWKGNSYGIISSRNGFCRIISWNNISFQKEWVWLLQQDKTHRSIWKVDPI